MQSGHPADGADVEQRRIVQQHSIAGRTRVAITFEQHDQINFQVPSQLGSGPMQATVILNPGRPNELRSDVATTTQMNYAPVFFTFSGGTSIAALTADFKWAVVPGGVNAKPDDIVLLYGSGFGVTTPANQTGQITIGGTTLAASDILYAGIAPQANSGLYQFNLRIPASAATGDLPVSTTIGGDSTKAWATIPILR